MLTILRRLFWNKSVAEAARERAAIRATQAGELPRLTEVQGVQRRSPTRPHDERLSELAHAWQRRLPPRLSVANLCTSYPRVANRLALCWGDVTLSGRALDEYLVDRRGHRRGFPPLVAAELLALREYLTIFAKDDPLKAVWDSHSQATVDRDRTR